MATMRDYGLRIRYAKSPAPLPAIGALANAVPPPPSASTHGWDTVSAVRLADVNRQFARPGICPDRFSFSTEVCKASGSFGPWRFVGGDKGGDGNIAVIAVPVLTGVLTFQQKDYSLDGTNMLISLQLGYLADPTANLKSGEQLNLVFQAKPSDQGVAAVVIVDYDHPNQLVQALLRSQLQPWFNTQLAAIRHTFASVNTNVALADTQFQWLAPTCTSYALYSGKSETEGYLGILSMTQGNPADGLAQTLSDTAIPSGAQAGFLISSDLFFRNLLLPNMAKAFGDQAKASDFTVNESVAGPSLTNCNEVKLPKVDGKYEATLQSFSMSVDAGEIVVQSLVRVAVSPGIRTFVKQISRHVLNLVDKPGGGKSLQLVGAGPPQSDHYSETDPGIQIVDAILTAVGVVAVLVLSVLTEGLAFLLAAMVVTLLTGAAAATPTLIATILGGEVAADTPGIDTLVESATGSTVWNGFKGFSINSATFASSLQLGGTLNAAG